MESTESNKQPVKQAFDGGEDIMCTNIIKTSASDQNENIQSINTEINVNNEQTLSENQANSNINKGDESDADENSNAKLSNAASSQYQEKTDTIAMSSEAICATSTDTGAETTDHQQLQVKDGHATQKDDKPEVSLYHLKWFDWKGEQTPIITQNENGPCPLLAIANVLILARKIVLPKMQQVISGKQLMEYIGDCILSEAPKEEGNEELLLNYEQNMQDAIDIMYKLQTGIDVNVKFSGVTEFEFTPECIVFDLLKIVLYHGWLVDPQDKTTQSAIDNLSYNQLVEKMIVAKDKADESATEGLIIEDFLSRTATQLTYYGLCELNTAIQEEELCVFFRNNHFSTLYKHKDELFLLVTDQGFLTEPAVVWETLVNIEGDGCFVNSHFKTITLESNNTNTYIPPKENISIEETNSSNSISNTTENTATADMSQEDRDYLIALSLQQEEPSPQSTRSNPSSPRSDNNSPMEVTRQASDIEDMDRQLALKLQEDEDKISREHHERQQHQQTQNTPPQRPSQHQQRSSQQQQQPSQQQQSDRSRNSPDKCIIV